MKKTLLTVAFALTMGLSSFAQGYYTQYYADKALVAKATEWVKSGEWRGGYNGASPHFSVNAVDFYQQYHKNPQQWQALFKWLAKTDLLALSKGKHPIEGSNLVASVEDDHNGPLETKRSESHNHKIDFQFVVKGVENSASSTTTPASLTANIVPTLSTTTTMLPRLASISQTLRSSSSSSLATGTSPKSTTTSKLLSVPTRISG